MTPKEEKIMKEALNQVGKKHLQLEKEALLRQGKKEGRKEGRKEGIAEAKKDIAKKLKNIHTTEEIAKLTGLTVTTILKL